MAELQLSVKYKPTALKPLFSVYHSCRWFTVVALPCAMLWAGCLYMLANGLALDFSNLRLFDAVGVLIAYLVFVFFSMVLFAPLKENSVKLSKEGIVLPWLVALKYGTRFNLIWQQIKEATIVGASGKEHLILMLDSGKKVALELRGFQKEEIEQLLLATELWGTTTRRSPELIDFQSQFQNEMRGVAHQSYTQMWEDELNRRFRSTTFLPLDPNQELQNGRLRVVRQLAFGGLSAIYLVQRDEQDVFVLKEAVVPASADQQIRAAAEKHLARESQLLCTLSHKSIARVFDYFVENGRSYLLMEHINGQDLRQLVRQNGPQPADKVIGWAIDLLEALRYLHDRQPPLIHRDLTPDNIVLDNRGSLFIIDFGAANEFLGTATGTLVGKQAYIAPEQLRGKATKASDIYALGATLYFLLTGREPLPLSSSHPRSVIPSIGADLDNLVARMTALETAERLSDVEEVLALLNRLNVSLVA